MNINWSLLEITKDFISSQTPVILFTAPGFDINQVMDQLSKQADQPYLDIALGSDESYEQANKLIERGLKEGQWVLIKNVHLAI